MIALQDITPHALPHWSPFAIAAGIMMGYLLGALTVALWCLYLLRRERMRSAGSGTFVIPIAPADLSRSHLATIAARTTIPPDLPADNTGDEDWRDAHG